MIIAPVSEEQTISPTLSSGHAKGMRDSEPYEYTCAFVRLRDLPGFGPLLSTPACSNSQIDRLSVDYNGYRWLPHSAYALLPVACCTLSVARCIACSTSQIGSVWSENCVPPTAVTHGDEPGQIGANLQMCVVCLCVCAYACVCQPPCVHARARARTRARACA